MAKLRSVHQCANGGNPTRLALTCNLEKVKAMRCFWEMKFEPEVSMQIVPHRYVISKQSLKLSEEPAGGGKTHPFFFLSNSWQNGHI